VRVLHVLPTRTIEYGGPVAVAEEIVAELATRGIRADLYPPSARSIAPWTWNPLTKRRLRAEISQRISETDLVHIHGLWNMTGTLAAREAMKARIPYVITAHGMLDRWARRRSRLKKAAYGWLFERNNLSKAAAIHFFNTEEKSEADEYGSGHRSFVIPNGVRVEAYADLASRRDSDRRNADGAGEVCVLFLGRLHPKKGLDLLLPAFAQALKSLPKLQLVIAGPGEREYERHLLALANRLAISGKVRFLGLVQGSRKLDALAAADFFVLPSYQEGDSIAVKEALASGLPAVITAACHFPEVASCNAGRIVRADIAELAETMCSLAKQPENLVAMSRNAATLIRTHYTWPRIVDRLLRVYQDVVNGTKASPDWA
jgi:glycosyltransferase involved in cell wall biosynthesis